MLYKTQGIVFHVLNYNDSSVIAKIYTERLGIQSFMINGLNKKKSTIKTNILQPLSLVDIDFYYKEQKQLHKIKEIKLIQPYISIPYNIYKNSMVLFLNEMVYKSIREEEPNGPLFQFIKNALLILDLKEQDFANFHLLFLLQLSKYLGFFPQGVYSEQNLYFSLIEGEFLAEKPQYPQYLTPKESNYLSKLIECSFETIDNSIIPGDYRKIILEAIIQYYELHLITIKEIKSYKILQEVMA